MKDDQATAASSQRSSVQAGSLIGGAPSRASRRPMNGVIARPAVLRVLIRPARPDDLEEATLIERRGWGRLGASLNELQRRLFALPEAFLLAEPQGQAQAPRLLDPTNGLLWTRDFPRAYLDSDRVL